MDDQRFRALLIGNWEYRDEDGFLQPLRGPSNDLRELATALTHKKFGFVRPADVIVERNLSSAGIGTAVFKFLDTAEPSDNLIIYYSGHGARLKDSRLALCGVEVQYSVLEAQAFDAEKLKGWVDDNRSPSTVIILDCCYSGQYKGVAEDTLERSFGTGTAVLASGGNEPSLDALGDDDLSPFTRALVTQLTNPALTGGNKGYLSVDDVYEALLRHTPKLKPSPQKNTSAKGTLALARRKRHDEPPSDLTDVPGYRGEDEQHFETVELVFSGDTVMLSDDDSWSLAQLDGNRRAAIRRLSQLADAVMRSADFSTESRLGQTVRKTWDCVGANLFETALPARLQTRIADELDDTGTTVLKLRLRFADDPARELECYPWEYLQVGWQLGAAEGAYPDPMPLGLRQGLLIERAAPDPPDGVGDRRSTPDKATVGLINALPAPLSSIGRQVSDELRSLPRVSSLFDLHGAGASWNKFVDALQGQRPQHLLLFAPVLRERRVSHIGFAGSFNQPVDWHSAHQLANELKLNKLNLSSMVVVTFAAAPGEDTVRGIFEVARTLSSGAMGPVVFVCHAPGFEKSVEQSAGAGPDSFPGRLIDALSRHKPLDRSVYYACDQVVRRMATEYRTMFGVPGYYAPDSAATPRRSAQTPTASPGIDAPGRTPGAARPSRAAQL